MDRINGFVLEISNSTHQELEVPLFKDFDLPEGVSIRAINTNYTYQSLNIMANSNFFIGGGFQSHIIQKIKVHTKSAIADINLDVMLSYDKILIDGVRNYLTIFVPPNTDGYFQLLPYLSK